MQFIKKMPKGARNIIKNRIHFYIIVKKLCAEVMICAQSTFYLDFIYVNPINSLIIYFALKHFSILSKNKTRLYVVFHRFSFVKYEKYLNKSSNSDQTQ